MGRVETAAEPHLDEGDIDVLLGEPAERERREDLELGGRTVAPLDPPGSGHALAGQTREGPGIDGATVDDRPLAVADEMGLGCLADPRSGGPQGRARQGDDAALAVRPGNKGAAKGALRIAQLAEDGARSPQPQPDPETAPRGEIRQRVTVGEGHSRVSSSS
jgi:hypothetical protein